MLPLYSGFAIISRNCQESQLRRLTDVKMETVIYTIVFHGGTEIVSAPEIRVTRRNCDFGPGFYATHSREQAARWTERQRKIRMQREAVVNKYDITGLWESGIKAKIFEAPTEEWLDSVVSCRKGMDVFAGFDVVLGPVADDTVYETIRLFEAGVFTRDETIRRLKVEKLFNQIVFKTETALGFCRFVGCETFREGVL